MMTRLITALALSSFVIFAACSAANQGTTSTHGRIPGQPEPGSPAAQMQQ
jgi:hypothetical protein